MVMGTFRPAGVAGQEAAQAKLGCATPVDCAIGEAYNQKLGGAGEGEEAFSQGSCVV